MKIPTREEIDAYCGAPLSIKEASDLLVKASIDYFQSFVDNRSEAYKMQRLESLAMAALIYGCSCDCPLCEAHRAADDARKVGERYDPDGSDEAS